ncbi:type VI secretion system protein TssA [Rahnella woolbedingensis]|uniref:Type VI secretion system protein TssA n=1 Tax=Rahnella woolbedingensis TaxID=1510574 RepID=A0A419NDH2_9GAMM|nr:type VI secretion system protein TssA [Rahnella woolbedingensis]RJT46510.1 type VI secretion system protein TssA [Rahnella woolbedingensis]
MEMRTPGAWTELVLAPLADEKIRVAISESNVDWEYIDSEMVKLGSLTHAQLDITEIQSRALKLLATESKDFRLMVHLLRTLQHAGKAPSLLLALQLLTQYIGQYWAISWPQKASQKNRFALQVIKRFETASGTFALQASQAERDTMLQELQHLAQLWLAAENQPLASAADELVRAYQRSIQQQLSVNSAVTENTPSSITGNETRETGAQNFQPEFPKVSVESHDDKSWRQTLLRVAELLCERHPQSAMGYRLRRHALWQNIGAVPQAENEGRTSLAAFPPDLMADYQSRLPAADIALWEQVEASLLLAPYWFDGHYLSSRIATQLGFQAAAAAIRDELRLFIKRLPLLENLHFTDHTPFLSGPTLNWLNESSSPRTENLSSGNNDEENQRIWQCFDSQGLAAALELLDQMQQRFGEPRGQFYRQFLSARLLEKAGLEASARQQYQLLHHTARQMTLPEWEPALLEQLKEKITTEQ